MKERIKNLINYLKTINPSLLSSSITFYLLFMLIPITSLILSILGWLEIPGYINIKYSTSLGVITIIGIVVSITWVSTKAVNALMISSNLIFGNQSNNVKKRWLKSYLLVLSLILFIVIQIISILFIVYFLESIIGFMPYTIIFIIQFILEFICLVITTSIIYKYIIPIKIKFINILFTGIIVTIIWYLILLGYKIFIKYIGLESYYLLYGNISTLILFLFVLYLIVSVYIYGIIVNFYLSKIYQNNKIINTHNNYGQSEVIK